MIKIIRKLLNGTFMYEKGYNINYKYTLIYKQINYKYTLTSNNKCPVLSMQFPVLYDIIGNNTESSITLTRMYP